jgi:hypothetical protein
MGAGLRRLSLIDNDRLDRHEFHSHVQGRGAIPLSRQPPVDSIYSEDPGWSLSSCSEFSSQQNTKDAVSGCWLL